MRALRLGIISESNDNISACREYCKLLLFGHSMKLITSSKKRFNWGTKITVQDIPGIMDYYKNRSVNCVVILTDSDGDTSHKNNLTSALQEQILARGEVRKYIVAVPHETFERWLISDIGAVNRVLKIRADKPSSHVSAKLWLDEKIGNCHLEKERKNHSYVYPLVALNSNLSALQKDVTFARFAKEFKQAVFGKTPFIRSRLVGVLSKRERKIQQGLSKYRKILPKYRTRK